MAPGVPVRPSGAASLATLPYVPVFEDRRLPHQIVIKRGRSSQITVGCNCLGREVIGSRVLWQPGEQLAAYLAWHEDRGIAP